MAFGEYTPLDYGQPVNDLQDAMLSGQVQTALQQRFDVNSVKLEEIVKQVTSIPILQQDAKNYLGERVRGALNIVQANMKASKGQGLLSNSVTTQLQGYIKDAIDDKVLTHLRYSQQIQNFESGVAKMKEKDFKTYNQNNYEFAKYQAGYNEYLNGTVDSKLGDLQYVPFKDVFGEALKKAEELKKLKGDQTVETLASDGITRIKRELKGLSPEEIVRYMPELVDSQSEQQMMIDGWAEMKNLQPSQISEVFNKYVDTKKNQYSAEIESIKDILNTDSGKLTSEQKQAYEQKVKIYESELKDIDNKSRNIDSSRPEQVGYLLKRESLLNTMSDAFTGRISETTDIDPVKKFEAEHQLALDKFELEKQKSQKEGLTKDKDGNYVSSPTMQGVWVDSVENQNLPDIDIVKQYEGEHNSLYNQVYSGARDIYNKLKVTTPTVKREMEQSMKRNGYILNRTGDDFVADPTYKGQVKSKADSYAIALLDSNVAQREGEFANVVADIIEANQMRSEYSSVLSKAYAKGGGKIKYKMVSHDMEIDEDTGEITLPYKSREAVPKTKEDLKAMREVLQANKVRPFVSDEKKFTFDSETHANIIKSISPDNISGGVFDYKLPFQVKLDKSLGTYNITQIQKGNADVPQKIISATVKQGSSTAGMLQNIIGGQVERAKELSVKDVPNGYTIKSPINKPTVINSKDANLTGMFYNSVDRTVTDSNLANELKTFSLEDNAKSLLSIGLQKSLNFDEQSSESLANKITNGVKSGKITGEIQQSGNSWIFVIKNNGEVINGYDPIGQGEFLNRDVKKAIMLYPSQTVLSYMNRYINSKATVQKIKELNQKL